MGDQPDGLEWAGSFDWPMILLNRWPLWDPPVMGVMPWIVLSIDCETRIIHESQSVPVKPNNDVVLRA